MLLRNHCQNYVVKKASDLSSFWRVNRKRCIPGVECLLSECCVCRIFRLLNTPAFQARSIPLRTCIATPSQCRFQINSCNFTLWRSPTTPLSYVASHSTSLGMHQQYHRPLPLHPMFDNFQLLFHNTISPALLRVAL